jgi:hypothetical protein
MSASGFDSKCSVSLLTSYPKTTDQGEFLYLNPKRSISQLKSAALDGKFVVYGIITDFLAGEKMVVRCSCLSKCS